MVPLGPSFTVLWDDVSLKRVHHSLLWTSSLQNYGEIPTCKLMDFAPTTWHLKVYRFIKSPKYTILPNQKVQKNFRVMGFYTQKLLWGSGVKFAKFWNWSENFSQWWGFTARQKTLWESEKKKKKKLTTSPVNSGIWGGRWKKVEKFQKKSFKKSSSQKVRPLRSPIGMSFQESGVKFAKLWNWSETFSQW